MCEGLEVLLSVTHFPDSVYRLLAIRYVFLFVLGWVWVKGGIQVNWRSITISLLSLIAIIYFQYLSTNDEPWFYSTNWKYHRWPCYFYVAYGLTALLYVIYQRTKQFQVVGKCVRFLATNSYEIFLAQMSIIFLFHKSILPFISNRAIQYAIWLSVVWGGSIIGGIFLQKLFSLSKCKETQLAK